MSESSIANARSVAETILYAPELSGKVFLEGGIVPWFISGRDSGRMHGDVDFSCRAENVPLIRRWLKSEGYYDLSIDSLSLECNRQRDEFGVHAFIDDVLVSFAPYEVTSAGIVQRNAVHESFGGYDALFEAVVPRLNENDFVEMRELDNGRIVGMSTLEAVRAAKVSTDREKDLSDIAEIDRIGYDEAVYQRVMAAFEDMTVECVAHSE